ncbi:MAG: hypothetical protein U1E65_12355 [Myxococcota bacterium]
MRWFLPLSALLFTACVELDAPPCTSAGKCLDGYECVDKQCLACVAGGCGGYQALSVGRGGGRVCSDDMGCVSIPTGALFQGETIWARRAAVQTTTMVEPRSAIYEFGPLTTTFTTEVDITVPISATADTTALHLFRLSGEGPIDLGGSVSGQTVTAKSAGLGLFVAAKQ